MALCYSVYLFLTVAMIIVIEIHTQEVHKLFNFSFVVAAVSPAVVVPCLLKLGEDGYGVEKGIPTLVIAAASMDDVLAITGFSVMMGLTFAKGKYP